ncbi:O-methyltransferase-domain-containing protein [Xylaria sp. FL1042]|nr:O-methyltransferase-domain-containing protein [Xylaria sp. FL1042]
MADRASHYSRPQAKTPIHAYFYSMVEISIIKFFIDYHLLSLIPEDGISIGQLAENAGVDYRLVKRFSNFLVASQFLASPAIDHVTHTPASALFKDPRASLFYNHIFNYFLVPSVKWEEYFQANGAKEPQESSRIPFGLSAGHPNETLYEILGSMPGREDAFNRTMAIALGDMPITGMYDFHWVEKYAAENSEGINHPARPLIVDVGGGSGQALKAILEENPGIPESRCVLQDQAQAIESAQQLGSVQKVAVSFFQPQPCKGALIYHIRRVLNDWSDQDCVKILKNIRTACAPDTRVLVSEQLLPETPSVETAAGDVWMMNFGGKRRNETMLAQIGRDAGFKIARTFSHETSVSAVIEMVPV